MPANNRVMPVGPSGPTYFKVEAPVNGRVWQFNSSNGRMELVDPSALAVGSDGQIVQNVNGVMTGIALPMACNFRTTLASSFAIYNPQPATPSSTDTGTEIVTFASAHGWVTGTMVFVSTTASGLTAGTIYYINALSGTTAAFYTTLANAEANTSKVNLTANVTVQINPVGQQSTTLKVTPYTGNRITLYDGTRWQEYTSAEMTLSLTATASTFYYIYCYSNSGTPTLEISTTATTAQDGVAVKSGDVTRRLVGWAYAVATNTFEDSGGAGAYAGNRCLVSAYNRVARSIQCCPGYVDDNADTTYTTTSTSWVPANGGTGATLNFLASGEDAASFTLSSVVTTGAGVGRAGLGINSTTGATAASQQQSGTTGTSFSNTLATKPLLGLNSVTLLVTTPSGTLTVASDLARHGSVADSLATYISGTVMA